MKGKMKKGFELRNQALAFMMGQMYRNTMIAAVKN
jgi:hypothetical protein